MYQANPEKCEHKSYHHTGVLHIARLIRSWGKFGRFPWARATSTARLLWSLPTTHWMRDAMSTTGKKVNCGWGEGQKHIIIT